MFTTLIVILLCIFLLLLIIGVIDGNRYVIITNSFSFEGLKKDCKFVMISDLHNKVYGKNNLCVIEDIRKINPDFVVIVGDLITSHVNESMEPGILFINAIAKEFPVYYAYGNHESKIKTDSAHFAGKHDLFVQSLDSANITMLVNDKIILEEYGIEITGLELGREYFPRFRPYKMPEGYLLDAIGRPEERYCNILLAHNPDYFTEYVNWGADLILSGHVHGGIMRLPILGGVIGPSYLLFPKYDGGIFKEGKSVMLLGRGMGAHTFKLRFFNPAELHVVNCLHK